MDTTLNSAENRSHVADLNDVRGILEFKPINSAIVPESDIGERLLKNLKWVFRELLQNYEKGDMVAREDEGGSAFDCVQESHPFAILETLTKKLIEDTQAEGVHVFHLVPKGARVNISWEDEDKHNEELEHELEVKREDRIKAEGEIRREGGINREDKSEHEDVKEHGRLRRRLKIVWKKCGG